MPSRLWPPLVLVMMGSAGCGDDGGNPICTKCDICIDCEIIGSGLSDWQLNLTVDPEFEPQTIENRRVRVRNPDRSVECTYVSFQTSAQAWVNAQTITDAIDRDAPSQPGCQANLPGFEDLTFTLEYEVPNDPLIRSLSLTKRDP